jgi:hypothetical protein
MHAWTAGPHCRERLCTARHETKPHACSLRTWLGDSCPCHCQRLCPSRVDALTRSHRNPCAARSTPTSIPWESRNTERRPSTDAKPSSSEGRHHPSQVTSVSTTPTRCRQPQTNSAPGIPFVRAHRVAPFFCSLRAISALYFHWAARQQQRVMHAHRAHLGISCAAEHRASKQPGNSHPVSDCGRASPFTNLANTQSLPRTGLGFASRAMCLPRNTPHDVSIHSMISTVLTCHGTTGPHAILTGQYLHSRDTKLMLNHVRSRTNEARAV